MKIMKKQSIFALMSAIALAGAVGFSSCSSDEKVTATPNPGYNQTEGTVPVQFLFNVGSYGSGASTRQEADATQATNNTKSTKFRGIENAHILCFNQPSNGQFVSSGTSVAQKDFNMARVAAPGSLGYNETGTSSKTTRVLEMTFPLGANSMIFYGKAIQDTENPEPDKYGNLDEYAGSTNLADVKFRLGKRLSSEKKTEFEQIQDLLAAILTCIMNTNRGTSPADADDVPEEGVDPYGYTIPTTPQLKWVDYYDAYGPEYNDNDPETKAMSPLDNQVEMTELELRLARSYKEMTTIHDETGELRNGSGPALLATIRSLAGIINSVRCAEPTTEYEAYAKYMAMMIYNEINKYFVISYSTDASKLDGGMPTSVSLRNTSTILIPDIKIDSYWNGEAFAADAFSAITLNNLNTFPSTFNLPQGATHLKFDRGTQRFSYIKDFNASAVGNETFTVDDYYYPAELLYFGNSPIRVSNIPHEALQYPQNTTAWTTENSETPASTDPWYNWTANGSVTAETRSVAMTNNINYGTALLEMTVGYSADVIDGTKKLYDNNAAVQLRDYKATEADHEIPHDGTSFKLVGVLIGGQFPKIGWNMLPLPLEGEEKRGYIFDNQITNNGIIPATGSSDKNYTMVFDNYNSTLADDAQEKVYIALELQNNTGKDFFGKDNLIPNGAHFYLIGKLDPTEKIGEDPKYPAPDLPAYHALPPYKNKADKDLYNNATDNPENKTIRRVFIQDHKTMVNFKIGSTSLHSAYLTVPDLRSSSVTLGLSVDMSWETGLNFDDIELGGTGN